MIVRSEDFRGCLTAARGGCRDALGRTLETCRRYLLTVARDELSADLRAKGGASDLVQDTFLEAQSAFDHFRGSSEGELRSWLRQLLHHRAAKFGRRYRTTLKRRLAREAALTGSGATGPDRRLVTPSVQLMADERAERLRGALERLPDEYRRVITFRYVEQLSFEDIGPRMGRTANAARLLWLRAIERVRKELGDLDEP
ncbi:MAG: sigma-70 family RNA polymerase sigma factor [Zavarzinella sp.]|nr:sigma-70 family RNA polymerase sigma factor [Zavarzinella sp.]